MELIVLLWYVLNHGRKPKKIEEFNEKIYLDTQVGDSLDDMTAGHVAGAATVLLANDRNEALKEHEHTDVWIDRLDELIGVLEGGFVGHKKGGEGAAERGSS
jgi:phosphoglycolate phosphatase-like HAD superfamily hydrolase